MKGIIAVLAPVVGAAPGGAVLFLLGGASTGLLFLGAALSIAGFIAGFRFASRK